MLFYSLQVKTIVTRQRIVCLISGMVVYEAVFLVLTLTLVHSPHKQSSRIRLFLTLSFVSIPVFVCFILVLFFTSFMVIRLRQSLEWRTATSTQSTKTSGAKERKVVLSVLWICVMFIVCFTPFIVCFVATIIYPRFSLWDPYYGWLVHIIYTFSYMFQTVSSSSNIFVYYTVSTKYREVLKGFFKCK